MARPSVKGRRLLALFLVGCALFNYPLLYLFTGARTVFDIPLLYAYIFAAWALLIALMAWVIQGRRD